MASLNHNQIPAICFKQFKNLTHLHRAQIIIRSRANEKTFSIYPGNCRMPTFLHRPDSLGQVFALRDCELEKRFKSLHKISGIEMISEPKDHPGSTINDLPPPLFDEIAARMAQPVEPLQSNRFSRWLKPIPVKRVFSRRVLALVIVIVSGVAAGAAGGAMLVRRDVGNEATVADQTKDAPADAETVTDAAIQTTTIAADAGGIQSRRRPRHHANRGRVLRSSGQSPPRAYKVATIH